MLVPLLWCEIAFQSSRLRLPDHRKAIGQIPTCPFLAITRSLCSPSGLKRDASTLIHIGKPAQLLPTFDIPDTYHAILTRRSDQPAIFAETDIFDIVGMAILRSVCQGVKQGNRTWPPAVKANRPGAEEKRIRSAPRCSENL